MKAEGLVGRSLGHNGELRKLRRCFTWREISTDKTWSNLCSFFKSFRPSHRAGPLLCSEFSAQFLLDPRPVRAASFTALRSKGLRRCALNIAQGLSIGATELGADAGANSALQCIGPERTSTTAEFMLCLLMFRLYMQRSIFALESISHL